MKATFTKRAAVAALATAMIGSAGVIAAAQGASAGTSVQGILLNTSNWTGGFPWTKTAPEFYVDNLGVVHFQGGVSQYSSYNPEGKADLIGTMPSDAPDRDVYAIVHTFQGTYADLEITTSGQIWLEPSANTNTTFVSLEGVSFYDGQNGGVKPIAASRYFSTTGAGDGSAPAGYYKDADGTVHLQGAVKQLSSEPGYPQLIGTMASDAPNRYVYTIVHTAEGTYADLVIDPSGQIYLLPSANTNPVFVSLEGVTYSLEADTPIQLSGNWTGIENTTPSDPSYGAVNPGWSLDAQGVVHLFGAVRQLTPESGVQLIGTLPAAVAPESGVYTIVHTLHGTYADLSIDQQGNIWLIPSSNTNTSFVSLDGVTYVPGY
jgi:hypothetical protein